MTKETMISKIKKLLALSGNNPSDEESFSALQKAQKLMAEYKISEMDLTDKEEKKCVQVKTEFVYSNRSSDQYMSSLSNLIAENFCCVAYSSRSYRSQTKFVCFMGMEEDVNVAIEVMTLANMAIVSGYSKIYDRLCGEYEVNYIRASQFNPIKEGYVRGYLAGLKKALESQKEQNQEWGLVLVAPDEAYKFLEGLGVAYRKPVRVNHDYYNQGYKDGSSFNMNKRLSNEGKYIEC